MMEWGIGLGVVGVVLLLPGLVGTCYYHRKEVRQLRRRPSTPDVSVYYSAENLINTFTGSTNKISLLAIS